MCIWLFLTEKEVPLFTLVIIFSHLVCSSALLNKAKKLSLKASVSDLSTPFIS